MSSLYTSVIVWVRVVMKRTVVAVVGDYHPDNQTMQTTDDTILTTK